MRKRVCGLIRLDIDPGEQTDIKFEVTKMEPTYLQHKLLEQIKKSGGYIITTETEYLERHWELVRAGYLNNICLLPSGWRFNLTNTAREYLSSIKKRAGKIKK